MVKEESLEKSYARVLTFANFKVVIQNILFSDYFSTLKKIVGLIHLILCCYFYVCFFVWYIKFRKSVSLIIKN